MVKKPVKKRVAKPKPSYPTPQPKKTGVGSGLLFIVAGFLLLACVGFIGILILGGDGDGDVTPTPTTTPTSTPTPTIPVSTGTYDDDLLSFSVPSGWPEGGIFGVNSYFIVNQDIGCSYAMNYLSPEQVEVYEADFIPYVQLAQCLNDENCQLIDQYTTETTPVFESICFSTEEEMLGSVEKCFAASKCNDQLFIISILQESTIRSIPMDEFDEVLNSVTCK